MPVYRFENNPTINVEYFSSMPFKNVGVGSMLRIFKRYNRKNREVIVTVIEWGYLENVTIVQRKLNSCYIPVGNFSESA